MAFCEEFGVCGEAWHVEGYGLYDSAMAKSSSNQSDRASIDPEGLELQIYPSDVLRKKAKAVVEVTDEVRAVAVRMVDVMEEEKGIGLAAPQIGLSWRMFVLDVPAVEKGKDRRSPDDDPPTASRGPMVFINPVLKFEGPVEPYEEGCLSLPDVLGDVLRPPVVKVTAMDQHGKQFTLKAGGLLARCIQHETDHLDGVLIIDKMTPTSRMKNRRAVKELEG